MYCHWLYIVFRFRVLIFNSLWGGSTFGMVVIKIMLMGGTVVHCLSHTYTHSTLTKSHCHLFTVNGGGAVGVYGGWPGLHLPLHGGGYGGNRS